MPSGSALRAGKAVIELGMRTGPVEKGLKALERQAMKIGAGFQSVGKVAAAAGGVITGAIAGATKGFISAGDQLEKMAARTGASVEALSELGYAAGQSGASLEVVERGMKGMARNLLDAERGLATSTENLAALGLSIDQLRGKAPDQQFTMIADALSRIEDPTRRSALAMKVFGKSGADLLPLFANGSAGMSELREQARELGLVMSTEDAVAAAKLGDAIDILMSQLKRFATQIGAAVAGPLTEWLAKTEDVAKQAIDFAGANRALIVTVAKIGTALTAAGVSVYALGTAFTVASTAIGAFRVALMAATAHPIVAAVAVVAAGIAALGYHLHKATSDAYNLANALNKVETASRKEQAAAADKLARLRAMEQLGKLTAAERQEVMQLSHELSTLYGIMGPDDGGIGTAGGVVSGLAYAEAQLTAARSVSDKPLLQLNKELGVIEQELASLRERKATEDEINKAMKRRKDTMDTMARMQAAIQRARVAPGGEAVAAPAAAEPWWQPDPHGWFQPEAEQVGDTIFDALAAGAEDLKAKIADGVMDAADAAEHARGWVADWLQKRLAGVQQASARHVPNPGAVLDARFAAQQFGGRNAEEKLLRDIKKNTDPRNQMDRGLKGVPG